MYMADPIPRIYLEIGSAMLSLLVRCCQRTDHATTSAARSPGELFIIFGTTITTHCHLFVQHHSRSTVYNTVAAADERLKGLTQTLRQVSLCAWAGVAVAFFFVDAVFSFYLSSSTLNSTFDNIITNTTAQTTQRILLHRLWRDTAVYKVKTSIANYFQLSITKPCFHDIHFNPQD